MDMLLVEDDDDFRVTVRQWMVRQGHRVVEAR
jgi:ActR/RegA family two-component response regulator